MGAPAGGEATATVDGVDALDDSHIAAKDGGVMDLLRFAAVGSVDDGKSTLIGRLLFDTRQLFDDQVEAVAAASKRRGIGEVDLSFVTDGLRAEREQGITIDVAYRYAATPRRKFVIADCPGHIQYTRNMATGASTADLALVVVDATTGLREQTRRHACIAALLGVDQFLVCANKMDLVDWDRGRLRPGGPGDGRAGPAARCGVHHGDPGVGPARRQRGRALRHRALVRGPHGARSARVRTGRRSGRRLMGPIGATAARLPVQWVLRHPGGGRSYAGMINGGALRTGDEVVVLPEGRRTSVSRIETFDGPLERAPIGLSVSVHLADDLDVSRGDLIASAEEPPDVVTEFEATVCWFGERSLQAGDRLRIKHTTRVTPVKVTAVQARLDVNALQLEPVDELPRQRHRRGGPGYRHLAGHRPLPARPDHR